MRNETATAAFVPFKDGGNTGTLCVRYSMTFYSEPKIAINYWPVVEGTRQHFTEMLPELDTETPLNDSGNGSYSFYRGNGSYSPILRLRDGGQTKPIKTEVQDYSCPKVRKGIETRYQNGRWEKYLKSEGWIVA